MSNRKPCSRWRHSRLLLWCTFVLLLFLIVQRENTLKLRLLYIQKLKQIRDQGIDEDTKQGNGDQEQQTSLLASRSQPQGFHNRTWDDYQDFVGMNGTWESRIEDMKSEQNNVTHELWMNGSGITFVPFAEGTFALNTLENGVKLFDFGNDTVLSPKLLDKQTRSSGIHVITTFFHGNYHDRRFKEIVSTLISNLENPLIDYVHILWEGSSPGKYIPTKEMAQKLVEIQVGSQPTYRTMFEYVNRALKRGSVAIVSNADLYFDRSLRCIRPLRPGMGKYPLFKRGEPRLGYALSRRHSPLCKKKNDFKAFYDLCDHYTESHDAFVLAPPIPSSVVRKTSHTQNQGFGAENIVIYEMKEAGMYVKNPCHVIRAYHLHCSPERHYNPAYVISRANPNKRRHGIAPPEPKNDRSACGIAVF